SRLVDRRLHRRGDRGHIPPLCRALRAHGPRHRGSRAMTADTLSLPPQRRRRRLAVWQFMSLLILALLIVWTAVPLFMAVMWSLVDPDNPWSPPAVLPPSLSLAQWQYVFEYSSIVRAVITSFVLAPV